MVFAAGSDPRVGQLVSRISASIDELVAVVREGDDPSVETVATVEMLGRLIDSARVAAAMPFVDTMASEKLGFATPIAAVASIAQVSQRTARERLAVAAVTRPDLSIVGAPLPPQYPSLAESLHAGRVGMDAAVLVTRQLDSIAPRVEKQHLALVETVMVNLATGLDPSGIRSLPPVSVDCLASELAQVAAAADSDGARPREERAIRRRSMRIGRQDEDGLMPVNGRVLPEIGFRLLAADEAARRSPRFTDNSVDDEGMPVAADTRTLDQRRHDAFAEIVLAGTQAAGSPSLDGAPVTVVVVVDEADLTNDEGRAGDAIGTMASSRFPVSRGQVERYIDAGGLRRVYKNSQGAVTGLGIPERCFSNPQRLGIAARDGYRCFVPGCTSPHYALQVHHVIPDRDRGPTAVDNGILLCFGHHLQVDTGPWQYRFVDGVPQVRGPGVPEWTVSRPARPRAA